MLSSLLRAFNNGSPTYPALGQLVKQPRYPNTRLNTHLALGTNWQPCGRHHGGYLIGRSMTTRPHRKLTYVDINHVFLAKEWNSFHLYGKKLDYRHLNDFLNYECELYLKKLLTPTQHNIVIVYLTNSINDNAPLLFESVMYHYRVSSFSSQLHHQVYFRVPFHVLGKSM